MTPKQKLCYAICSILGVQGTSAVLAADSADESSDAISEIVVTAQRREENLQNVPIQIQALTAETLSQLNVVNVDQFIKYLPNVTMGTGGPAQGEIFMRGLSVGGGGGGGSQGSGTTAAFPGVAIYLDEQSGQLPGRNLDVYAADLERIEVLEGPQGTLFGGGALSGVLRYITNKPKLDVTEGSVDAGYGVTAHGDPNSNVTAVINLPLIENTLAVRGVVYNDRQGGYINNVPAVFSRSSTDLGIARYNGGIVPTNSASINNANVVGNAINPLTYTGMRVEALWKINNDWDALLTQSYQNMDAEGVFYEMPFASDGAPLPPESVTLFNPSYNKDRFENTAWVLNGRVGALNLVYAGSYLVRNVESQQDYTNYARGKYADYYQCHGADNGLSAACYSPSTTWNETLRNTHQSHELRLSTPDSWRLRAIGGLFWENLRIYDQLNWAYKTLPPCTDTVEFGCLTNVGPTGTSSLNNPAPIRPDNVAFFNDVKRGYTQRAAFASADFDILPKVLTITAGTRYYHFDNDEKGAVVGSFGCYEAGAAPCTASATNIDSENLKTTYKGFKSRANLTWHITPDVFVYYTWSQGFRPGAFNRQTGCYVPNAQSIPLYCSPLSYASDDLTNNELGWKTEFFDHRLQWNSAVYQEDWKNVQVSFFDPGVLGNVGFNTNGPTYRIRGFETSAIAVLMKGLTATAAAAWNSSNQTNSPFLIANNPMLLGGNSTSAAEYGKPITSIVNPYGPPNSPASNAPPLMFNLRLRYQWNLSLYNMFVQAGAVHTAHSFTQSGSNPELSSGGAISTTLLRFENPAYTTYDASIGAAKDAWWAELSAQNLTNVLASTFTSTSQFALQQTTLRPRVIGVTIGYKF